MAKARVTPRKQSQKSIPRKSKPKQLSVDQIVDRELKKDKENIAAWQQRLDILGEYFNQTIKLSWAIWNMLREKFNYYPGELDHPENCDWFKAAHERLHQAARSIREGNNELYKELREYKGNVKKIEVQIREREENRRQREVAKTIVAKRLAVKA